MACFVELYLHREDDGNPMNLLYLLLTRKFQIIFSMETKVTQIDANDQESHWSTWHYTFHTRAFI